MRIVTDKNILSKPCDLITSNKTLFERASEYLPGKEGTVAILVNDHQYKGNFRIDKEINTMSLIQQIINNK